jgi:hypothetical protein
MARTKKVKEEEAPSKKEKTKTQEKTVKIPKIEFGYAKLTLVGDTPLLVKQWSKKASDMMKDRTTKTPGGKRPPRDPHQEFLDSMYVQQGNGKKVQHCVHAGGLKKAVVSASRFAEGIYKADIKGAFHIINADPITNLVPMRCSEPQFDEKIGRIGGMTKVASHIYRARYDKWEVDVQIKYLKNAITLEQILYLFEVAGFSIGLHEFRTECGGTFGTFSVKRSN